VRVAIAGAGNVGQFIAADLLAAGHQVTMIEKDPSVVEAARHTLQGAEWFPFDACEVLSLVMAGLSHADVVVAATGDDEDNLVISLLAKQEFAVPRVVARVNNPKNHGLFNEAWGVDVAVSTPHILRSLVEEAVTVGSMVRLMQFEQGQVSLHEVTLAEGSPSIGRTLRDLALPVDAAVVAVVREGHVVVPKEDTVFAIGDEVLAVATAESEDYVRKVLVGEARPREQDEEPSAAGTTATESINQRRRG
jgi:trk system potassium uptake protein TrkA